MGEPRDNAVGHTDSTVEDRIDKKNPKRLESEAKEWIFENRTVDPNTPPVVIKLSMGLTKNLDNYESARIDIGVEIPCLPEEVPEYVEKAKVWIGKMVQKEVRRINKRFARDGRLRS